MCELAKKSERPKSVLNIAISAINAFCRASNISNPCSTDIKCLCNALVKTHTVSARKPTNILPIQPFNDLFMSWKTNDELTLKNLRIKTLTILAFAFMLRPSDIAPHGLIYDETNESMNRLVFSRDQIQFNTDGSLTLTFFGIKNDTCRDGFKVSIPKSTEPKLDPSTTLKAYINRTKSPENLPSDPVFVSLNRPFKAISSTTVSLILNESIKLAGLDCAKFTAKSFRPSAATKAVESGMDPDKARRIGRWKTPSVFFDHYVFDKTPENYTDNILDSS